SSLLGFAPSRPTTSRYALGVSEHPCSRGAIDLVAPHCDIVARLQDVPPSARVRGLYFKSVINVLRSLDKLDAFSRICPPLPRASVKFYPLADYLVELAVAGAMVASPAEL